MLWISLGRDNALADEVARQSGLKAVIAAADTPEWKKRDTRRCRVIVIELPASSAFVQEVMTAAQDALRPVPVVILDREGSLDESLIGPSLSLFQHLVGDRSAEEISAHVLAALRTAAQKWPFESQESWVLLVVG